MVTSQLCLADAVDDGKNLADKAGEAIKDIFSQDTWDVSIFAR